MDSLLKQFIVLSEAKDMTELPYDVFNDLQKHIHKGAKDLDKKITNALDLVKEAYKVENVDLPEPSMKKAWGQLETLITYATQKLTKFRGIDGDWRISAYRVVESIANLKEYSFKIKVGDSVEYGSTEADTIEEVVEEITAQFQNDSINVKLRESDEGLQILEFYRMHIKQPMSVEISPAD